MPSSEMSAASSGCWATAIAGSRRTSRPGDETPSLLPRVARDVRHDVILDDGDVTAEVRWLGRAFGAAADGVQAGLAADDVVALKGLVEEDRPVRDVLPPDHASAGLQVVVR